MKDLKYLNRYFVRYKYRFLLGIFFVILANLFGILPPQVIRVAIDLVKDNVDNAVLFQDFAARSQLVKSLTFSLLIFGGLVLLLAAMRGFFTFLQRQTIIVMSRLIEFDLKNDVYQHYQTLDNAFYKRNNTGDLMNRATEDVSRVRMYLGPAVMYALNTAFLFIMVIGTMLSVNAELTAYVLLPLPILSVSIYYVSTIINKKSEVIQKQLSFITTVSQEFFSGIRVLKSYVQEKAVGKYFDEETERYKEKTLSLARVESLFFPLMILLIGLSTILTIYVGGIQVMKGNITAGNIAEFVIYVNMLTWPVTSVGWVASIVQRAAASQKRLNEFLNTPSNLKFKEGSDDVAINGKIEFSKVHFTYEDTGVKALEDVSFELPTGNKMAIIGRTGSGKSTIAELITRIYDPTLGNVLVDGNKVQNLPKKSLRQHIAYVPQDVFLFSDTIFNNIAFGLEGVTKKAVEAAASKASIHNEIVGLPNGYETIVGERGVTLSGGQKQRISIARAFLRDAQIIVLDDCLSAVDAKTEHTILNNLNNHLANVTTIIITHRIFTLVKFDQILVLDEGRIAEQGDHQSLLKLGGLYWELYQKQLKEDTAVA